MHETDVIAVMGACGPERAMYAERLSLATGKPLLPASRLSADDPAAQAAAFLPWLDLGDGVIAEFPADASVLEVIGTLAEHDNGLQLTGVVCIVDAPHLVDDLRRETYAGAPDPDETGMPRTRYTAHALLTVQQLEYASTIVLVNWAGLSTPDLSITMALVSHLAPSARLRLHQEATGPLPAAGTHRHHQEAPGWVQLLNGEFAPHMTDSRISAFRYENVRPLHPGRLTALLDERIESGQFGFVVRSAGFCRFATRSHTVAQWDHVGSMIAFSPVQVDDGMTEAEGLLAVGEDLAFIGLDLHHRALRIALDETALTDDELAAGPAAWAEFEDPFPVWQVTRSGE
ncbi:GTP-binding protein [Microbacterium sp. MM2322]|uniref:GTP-binding protein n=1 Tax=Microbacterium sp. MM2322 TaxID=3157631 RepID=UPI0032D58137